MRNRLMAGVCRYILGVPPFLWERQIEKARRKVNRSTRFMTQEHRSIHHFVVRELPRAGRPISPEMAALDLALPLQRTREILEDLEKHLTFLYRNKTGEVTWAYPVTVERTPHAVAFGSGEQLYAAWSYLFMLFFDSSQGGAGIAGITCQAGKEEVMLGRMNSGPTPDSTEAGTESEERLNKPAKKRRGTTEVDTAPSCMGEVKSRQTFAASRFGC